MTNTKFAKYDDYKESGVEWLGRIPQSWDLIRLKDVTQIRNSNVDKLINEGEISIQLCNYVNVYNNEFIDFSADFMWATANDAEIKNFSLIKDDVLITKDSETFEDIAVPALVRESFLNVLCGYHLALIRCHILKLSPRYLHRLFQSYQYGFRFRVFAKGITRFGLGQSGLRDALTPIPSLPEQTAIANYLDKKTSLIDRKINLLTKKAELYTQLKQSLINETVTRGLPANHLGRGLDKTVPLKDSSIEWLGKIPVHWKVKRLKDLIISLESGCRDKGGAVDDGIVSLSAEHINWAGAFNFDSLKYISANLYDKMKNGKLKVGDTILTKDGATIGKCAYINKQYFDKMAVNEHMFLIRSNKYIASKFLYYLIYSKVGYDQLRSQMKTTAIPGINLNINNATYFPIPSKNEQCMLIEFLDKKTYQIDKIIETINTQIEKLKELRKTLINDVVTGKIKVYKEGKA